MNLTTPAKDTLRYLLTHVGVTAHVPDPAELAELTALDFIVKIPGIDVVALRDGKNEEVYVPFRDAELEAAITRNSNVFRTEIDGNGDAGFYVIRPA